MVTFEFLGNYSRIDKMLYSYLANKVINAMVGKADALFMNKTIRVQFLEKFDCSCGGLTTTRNKLVQIRIEPNLRGLRLQAMTRLFSHEFAHYLLYVLTNFDKDFGINGIHYADNTSSYVKTSTVRNLRIFLLGKISLRITYFDIYAIIHNRNYINQMIASGHKGKDPYR